MTALQVQRRYLALVQTGLEGRLSAVDQLVIERWGRTLDTLEHDFLAAAAEVEWVGKYALLERQRKRLGAQWDDARIIAMDLQWSDLRPHKSLVGALQRAGMVESLFTQDQVEWAADNPPSGTRAAARGAAVRDDERLVQASWTSLVTEAEDGARLIRTPLVEPVADSPVD